MNFLTFIINKQFVKSVCAVSVIALAAPVSAQSCCDVGGDDEDNIATTATIPLAGDMFGSSLAMDGDTAVVGAPFNDIEIDNGGRAYGRRRKEKVSDTFI